MKVYTAQYANLGLKFLITLALQDLLKNYYKIEPAKAQSLQAITFMPYSLKFFFGIMADSIVICGSRKRSWMILWSAVSTICALICACVYIKSSVAFTALVLLFTIGLSFNDVIVDSLMVIQARRDPKMGS